MNAKATINCSCGCLFRCKFSNEPKMIVPAVTVQTYCD